MHRACSFDFISSKSRHKKNLRLNDPNPKRLYRNQTRVFFFNRINNTQLIKRKFVENIKIHGSLSTEIIDMVHLAVFFTHWRYTSSEQ